MRLRIILILILVLVPFSLSAEDEQKSYFCVAHDGTGFKFNKSTKEWDEASFNVDDAKYIVRPVKKSDKEDLSVGTNTIYGVWKVGNDYVQSECLSGFNEYGWLFCGNDSSFVMNTKTLRFIYSFRGSYVIATMDTAKTLSSGDVVLKPDAGGDTPYVQIGKCSEI